MIPPANTAWFEPDQGALHPVRPRRRRKLVASSGFPNPTVHLLVRSTTDRLQLAQFIQAEEAAVGINVVLDVDRQRHRVGAADERQLRRGRGGLGCGPGDPTASFDVRPPRAVSNQSGYSNPRLDFVLANGLKATSRRHGPCTTAWRNRSSTTTGR